MPPGAGPARQQASAGAARGAEFWVKARSEKVPGVFGPNYTVGVCALRGRNFTCFETMSAVTNAFNPAHAGLYLDLQTIPPGGLWQESFRIRPGRVLSDEE